MFAGFIDDESFSISVGSHADVDRLALFDLDGTIINTRSGRQFPVDSDDWILNEDVVAAIGSFLRESDTHGIAIITNQAGLTSTAKKEAWHAKVICVVTSMQCAIGMDMPVCVMCSAGYDKYRKPCIGWYNKIRDECIGLTCAFYCGDAAGRLEIDHSDTDYKFAINCGLPFYTPEQLVGRTTNRKPRINYVRLTNYIQHVPLQERLKYVHVDASVQMMIILVGCPGSGKSRLAKEIISNNGQERIAVVNQDACKSKRACHVAANRAVQSGQSVIIDNTNPSVAARREWIDIAAAFMMHVRIIHLTTPAALAKHNNVWRSAVLRESGRIPEVAYRVYAKKFEMPSLDECDGVHASVMSVPFAIDVCAVALEYFSFLY